MKNSIKTLAIISALSGLYASAVPTPDAMDPTARFQLISTEAASPGSTVLTDPLEPTVRFKQILTDAQNEARLDADRTRKGRVAELMAKVESLDRSSLDITSSEFHDKNPTTLKEMICRYKRTLFFINDRTAELTAELEFMRNALLYVCKERFCFARSLSAELSNDWSTISTLIRASSEKNAKIAELEATLAVRRVNTDLMKPTMRFLPISTDAQNVASLASADDMDPTVRFQRILNEAQDAAMLATVTTREKRVAELMAKVESFDQSSLDITSSEFHDKNLTTLKEMTYRYKQTLLSIDDRTAELTAEIEFMRYAVSLACKERFELSRFLTTKLMAQWSTIATLTRACDVKDARIAELEAALAVRRGNKENIRSRELMERLPTASQATPSRTPSADPGRRPQVATAATVATPQAASSAASTVVSLGAPQ